MKMNETVNKFILAGDKFMPQMHLRHSDLTQSASKQFTEKQRNNPQIQRTKNSRYIYQNKLDKACFQHDMAYGDLKGLNRRTAAVKLNDGYQRRLASIVYEFFDKKILIII